MHLVIALIGLLLFGIIIDLGPSAHGVPLFTASKTYLVQLGGNPKRDRIGFRYWKAPNGPMGKYLLDQVHDTSLSIFLGFWATLTNALFAYMGTELIGVTVGEAQNPRKNIPTAIRSQ
jgi:yeast amino acid transporter